MKQPRGPVDTAKQEGQSLFPAIPQTYQKEHTVGITNARVWPVSPSA